MRRMLHLQHLLRRLKQLNCTTQLFRLPNDEMMKRELDSEFDKELKQRKTGFFSPHFLISSSPHRFFNPLLESLVSFFYPDHCSCCQKELGLTQAVYICDECWGKIELVQKPYCEICGRPMPRDTALELNKTYKCGWCLKEAPLFSKVRSVAYYEPTLKEAIHLLKYQKKEIMAKPLAELMITALPTLICIGDYDCLIPVPLHKNRQRDRGYNQVQLMVDLLKDHIGLPVEKKALLRIKETKPQSSLDTVNQKFENVKGAFAIKSPEGIRSKKILLVDDIFTTGATISEATKILLKAGASRVDVLTLARAG